jgi:hypothetical protein
MEYIKLPEQEIIDAYLTGISSCKLAEQYGVSRWVIDDRLARAGVKHHKQGSLLRKCKNINEHYFDIIDTEEKAYFLGLLYADGCNHRDKKKKVGIAKYQELKAYLATIDAKKSKQSA